MSETEIVHMEVIRRRELASSFMLGLASLLLMISLVIGNNLWQTPFADAKALFARASEGDVPHYLVPTKEESPLPTVLRIGSLGVEAHVIELGLQATQEIEVPESFEEVGWYVHGSVPGEIGPAVILGHVDSKAGPAVFYDLKKLEKEDTIDVVRADGSIAIFRVTKKEVYPQSVFPNELVFADARYAELRLVTCTGVYNKDERRYSHNLVVYAELLDIIRPHTL